MTDHRGELKEAIRNACVHAQGDGAPHLVVWSKRLGWHQRAISEPLDGATPEFICWVLGKHPFPLNPTALDAWISLLRSELTKGGVSCSG